MYKQWKQVDLALIYQDTYPCRSSLLSRSMSDSRQWTSNNGITEKLGGTITYNGWYERTNYAGTRHLEYSKNNERGRRPGKPVKKLEYKSVTEYPEDLEQGE